MKQYLVTEKECPGEITLQEVQELPPGGKWLTREQVRLAFFKAKQPIIKEIFDELFGPGGGEG